MKVKDFADKVRSRKPEFSHLDDTDLIQMIAQRKPELLGSVDREDIALTMQESRKRKVSQERQKAFKSLSGVSRFGIGAKHGMIDVFMGIKQILSPEKGQTVTGLGYNIPGQEPIIATGAEDEDYEASKKEYKETSEGDFAAGAGEVAGALLATAPVPGVTGVKVASKVASPLLKTATKVLTPVTIGAGMGATEFVDKDETRLKNAAFGALFGAGGAGVGVLAKKIGVKSANAIKGRMKDAKVQELYDIAKKHNIDLSRGDLTQKSLTKKAEVAAESKVGGLSKFREKQAQDANKIMTGLVDDLGKNVPKRTDTGKRHVGKELQESVIKSYKKVKKQARENYQRVDKLTGVAKIEPTNSINRINKIIKKEDISDVPTDDATMNFIKELSNNLSSGKKNLKSLRATRQSLGKVAANNAETNPNLSRLIYDVQDAVEKDMDQVIEAQISSMTKRKGQAMKKLAGEDLINPFQKGEMRKEAAKQTEKAKELKQAYEIAKKQYREEVVPYNANRTLRAVRKTNEPSQIYKTMIQSDNPDRAVNFYKALDKPGREAVEFELVNKALGKAKVEVPSGTNYSPAKFVNELNRLDEAGEVFFSKENSEKINGIKKILKAAVRAGQYMENPPTGNRGEIAKELRNAKITLGLIPLLTQVEKHFWTGKGKNFLLAASELEPGSIPMQNLIAKIYKNIPKVSAQTGKEIKE